MKRILPETEFTAEQLNIIARLAEETGFCVETVKILYGRGVDDARKIRAFLNPSEKHFLSPFLMSGMKEAVQLITRARDEDWTVVVYGDYDADGVCASTIMRGVLSDFGIEPIVFVPERRMGYGLSVSAIDEIMDEYFPQLFITVDCGISNAEEINYIKEQGAEVIVTDHHELPDRLPDCITVNPKICDDYPYDNLCGAGVAFKVGCALNGESAKKYLDFVAIATVADSVPLTGENRDLVYEGIKLINKSPRACYAEFLNKAEPVNSQTIAFTLAPKINAAGRMGDANAALALFCETDPAAIYDYSVKLALYNQERQKCCDELYLSAKEKLKKKRSLGNVIMLWDESWNSGFVGIVAARLADEYSRPAVLFVRNGDMLKGSARSIDGVNIFEALKACGEYISEFGGHSQAAGINIDINNFEALESALGGYLLSHYPAEDFVPTYYINGTFSSNVNAKLVKELERLEPFGVGNRRPLFVADVKNCPARPTKFGSPHLSIKCGNLNMMYFSGSRYASLVMSAIPKRLLFEFNVSLFRGKEYIKGFVKDIVYKPEDFMCAEELIKLNGISYAAAPEVKCDVSYITREEAQNALSRHAESGTLFIAYGAEALKHYDLCGIDVNLFVLPFKCVSDCVLLSPQPDADLSGYDKIIYLDNPMDIRLAALQGKSVCVCSEIDGNKCLLGLDTERERLLGIFKKLSSECADAEFSDLCEVAFALSDTEAVQTYFALKVFEQLQLIYIDGGRLCVRKGVKTQLTNSPLYNAAAKLNGSL